MYREIYDLENAEELNIWESILKIQEEILKRISKMIFVGKVTRKRI